MPTKRNVSWLRAIVAPLEAFFRTEASGGVVLALSAVVAMAWANSPFAASYFALIHWQLPVPGTPTPARVVNEGLMALFFLVVGLEIKRELTVGELASWRRALLPGLAALGGMVVPAAVFLAFTRGTPGARGWGIPMATDIAFSLGCLSLLSARVPRGLVVFMMALAIFDDLGGILVIALFYGNAIDGKWLLLAVCVSALIVGVHRSRWSHVLADIAAGVLLWIAFFKAGLHPTLAGVLLGLLIPARPEVLHGSRSAGYVRVLHPLAAYAVAPLFALVNVGVSLRGFELSWLLHPVALGAALGLLIGKPLGISLVALLTTRLGLAEFPAGVRPGHVLGSSVVAGIGFTVALFIAALAFGADRTLLDRAKLGILLGSAVAAVFGTLILARYSRRPEDSAPNPK